MARARGGQSSATKPRARRGELAVKVLSFTKAELAATPPAHLGFYLSLGQIVNEVTILQSLLLRSINAITGPRVVRETSLGIALLLTRTMCGKLVEAHKLINAQQNTRLLVELWDALPSTDYAQSVKASALEARTRLNKEMGPKSSLMRLVRNKLASHMDQQVLVDAFSSMPEEFELADFHTRMRGTTFFGVADTVAALAVSELTGVAPTDAVDRMAETARSAASDLQEFAEGFLVAFYLVHIGESRLRSAPEVVLNGLPELETARIGYFIASKRRAQGGRQ